MFLRRFAASLFGLLMISLAQASACPVCYGEKGSAATEGLNWAIVFLLGVTGTVLSAVGAFFLRMKRRSKVTLDGDVDSPSVN